MRDRESTQILSNGAVRYGIYDESGTLLRYEYIKLEDVPTVAGSLYNRANVLPDEVTEALRLEDTAEPRDAFLRLWEYAYKRRPTTFEKFVMGRAM